MGIRYANVSPRRMIQNIATGVQGLDADIQQEMEQLAEVSEERMIAYSDARKNRISGDMVRAMEHQVYGAGSVTRFRVGFIRDFQDYYAYQTTTGFTHRGGNFIEQSFALRDARQDAMDEMPQLMDRVLSRLSRRIG